MSMDKRWGEMFARLEAIEAALAELKETIEGKPQTAVTVNVNKEDLTRIKGVGSATADEILKLLAHHG